MRATKTAHWSVSFGLVSGISFLAWANGVYLGDDGNTLFPVAQHSLLSTVKYYIRPLEYYLLQGANAVGLQVWVAASLALAVFASVLQVKTVERIVGTPFGWPLAPLVAAASPLWFYVLSQVDTISQAICDVTLAGAVYLLFTRVVPPKAERVAAPAALVNLLAAFLLYSKELAVVAAVVLPMITIWIVWRRRQINLVFVASVLLFGVASLGWLYLKMKFPSQRPEAGGHYNLSPSPMTILTNLLSVAAFPSTPLPTAFLSIAKLRTVWSVVALACAGILTLALGRLALRHPNARQVRLLLIILAGSAVPIIYVHSSELYGPMLGGYLIPLLIGAWPGRQTLKVGYCLALLACSYGNAALYYAGPHVSEHGFARVEYSIYDGPNGIYHNGALNKSLCPIRGTDQVAWSCGVLRCLPRDAEAACTTRAP